MVDYAKKFRRDKFYTWRGAIGDAMIDGLKPSKEVRRYGNKVARQACKRQIRRELASIA